MSAQTVDDISEYLIEEFDGLKPKSSWGETSYFYNPKGERPHGTYFLTIKEKNGDNDKASQLDRAGIYRINFGLSHDSFKAFFGAKPTRPGKGEIIEGDYDFTELDKLTPHPIYGWMNWVAILNPSKESFAELKLLIAESYDLAVTKFNKKK